MAIPIEVTSDELTEEKTYYIVEISGSSQFKGAKSWDLDTFNRHTQYNKPKETRDKIAKIRQGVYVVSDSNTMKFHRKIKFTNANGKTIIEQACLDADRRMKEIDPSFHITPLFFPQTVTQLNTSNMFEQMKSELNEQVITRVLDRVEDYIEKATVKDENGKVISITPISAQVRRTLLKAAEQTRSINILNDPKVNTRIDQIKTLLESSDLTNARDELLKSINDLQGETELEISPEYPVEGLIDPDGDKYKARPMKPAEVTAIEEFS